MIPVYVVLATNLFSWISWLFATKVVAFPVLLFSYGGCFEVQLQVMEKLGRTERFAGHGAIWIWYRFLQAKADHKPREANFFL